MRQGCRALDHGRAVVIPGMRNKLIAFSGRLMPREWLARVGARLLRPADTPSRPPIVVNNEIVIRASAEHVWDLLTDVERWPAWYRACKWVTVDSTDRAGRAATFRWKAHPVVLQTTVTAMERPHTFAFIATARGFHAVRRFTVRPTTDGSGTVVASYETQVGIFPWLGRVILGPRLRAANQVMFADLAQVAEPGAASQAAPASQRPRAVAASR